MTLEKKPFVRYNLEDNSKYSIFTVRLNSEEQAWLQEIKEDLNIHSNSKALKFAAFLGKNVLQAMFSRKILQYLFKKKRPKLTDLNQST
jgi:hypothetical protein